MQNTPVYLLNNRTDIIMNESGFVTEYRAVYQKQLKVYKGIDNKLQFRLLNADQKPQDISALTPYFVAYDENKSTVIEKIGTSLQTSDSTVFKNKGLFEVALEQADIQDLDDQFLTYSIYFKNTSNENVLTYVNSYFGGTNTIHLSDSIYPDPQATTETSNWTEIAPLYDSTTEWVTESIYAKPESNNNDALHTIAFYTSTYAGNIKIQATLENQITNGTNWVDVSTVAFDGSTSPTVKNINGVYTYLRFFADADPEDIEKIQIRN